MKQKVHDIRRIRSTIGTLLMVLAVLKIVHFLRLPMSLKADPVVDFITERELLIIVAGFEIIISAFLLAGQNAVRDGLIMLHFCAVATLYQISLTLIGDPPCGCLGIANEWIGSAAAKWIGRISLIVFWVAGYFLYNSELDASNSLDIETVKLQSKDHLT